MLISVIFLDFKNRFLQNLEKLDERHRKIGEDRAMRIGVLQMDIAYGNRRGNWEKVRLSTERAMALPCSPHAFILPELWSTGYALSHASALASPMGREDADFLSSLASSYHVAFIGGSVLSEYEGAVYNRAQFIDSAGRYLAGYDKIHLFRLMDEHRYLSPGKKTALFDFCGIRCAMAICYDIRFCELIRTLAVHGAEVLFVSAEWPLVRKEHWETLLRARAIENQMFVVACNRCGSTGKEVFAGNSMIIAPDGTILCRAGEGEEIISAEIDVSLVRRARAEIPVFQDRVPDLYF